MKRLRACPRGSLPSQAVDISDVPFSLPQGGGRTSVDAFVFERRGFPTRNYYLGWSDWGNVEDTPVETGPATKPGPR